VYNFSILNSLKMAYENLIQNLPNYFGIPTCSMVEPSWANIFKNGLSTPSQVVIGNAVIAELQAGNIFGDIQVPVLVKNPLEEADKKIFGVRNAIIKLSGQLIVCAPDNNNITSWVPKRVIDWDNFTKPTDIHLVKNFFNYYLGNGERPNINFEV